MVESPIFYGFYSFSWGLCLIFCWTDKFNPVFRTMRWRRSFVYAKYFIFTKNIIEKLFLKVILYSSFWNLNLLKWKSNLINSNSKQITMVWLKISYQTIHMRSKVKFKLNKLEFQNGLHNEKKKRWKELISNMFLQKLNIWPKKKMPEERRKNPDKISLSLLQI